MLEFCHFTYVLCCIGPFWVPLAWDSLCFLDLGDFFSHQIREIFHHYLFKQVFYPLLFFFSFWYPYYTDIMFSCISINPSSFFLSLFSFSSSFCVFFSTLPSSSLIRSSASSSLLLIPSTVFFNSEIVFLFPLGLC